MDAETKRIKYRYLLNRIVNIRSKLKELEADSKELYTYTSESVKIDDECVGQETFDSIKNDFVSIKSELREKLIFSISKKI
jgi:uncharacterized coiled-coil DUF342 family protein